MIGKERSEPVGSLKETRNSDPSRSDSCELQCTGWADVPHLASPHGWTCKEEQGGS